ncbi:MAG: transporter [Candidatus Saccharibacteria bacterium]|nr:transporter [Candidatus Saccharibacteria bacterium]
MPKKAVNKTTILILLALAQFMVILDSSIVNVAIPAINRELHFSPENLQWIVTAYTLTFGGFLLLGGRAADLFGRRRMFTFGLIAFTSASFIGGLSQNSGMLVALRAIQGLSAAFMSPAALSIVINTFKQGKERNRALGVWGGVAAGGAAAGLLFGGVLTEYLGWRWDFFVNVPIGLAVIFFVQRIIPESKADMEHQHLDLPGAVLATSGLMILVYALVKAPEKGWGSSSTILLLLSSVVLLAGFIFNETRSKQPLVPLSIFKLRNLSAANLVQLPITAGMLSMFFFLSLYVQTVMHYSPVRSGLAFLPVTVVIGISSAIVSILVGKIGYKIPMTIAPLFITGGLLIFSRLPVHGTYLGNVLPGLIVMALGLGFSFVSITIAATSGVSKHQSGLASGILNTSQQIGGALGLAILSGVFAASIKSSTIAGSHGAVAQVAGYHDAFMVASFFTLAASIIAAVGVKHVRGEHLDAEPAPAV